MITQLTKKSLCFFIIFFAFTKLNAQCSFCFGSLAVSDLAGCKEKISWHPDTESSTMSYWAIDRSTNGGSSFVQIGTAPGMPNTVHSDPAFRVNFTDNNPYSLTGSTPGSTVYYRVRAVNIDGLSNQVSNIVTRTLQSGGCGLGVDNTICNGTPVINAPSNMTLCDPAANAYLTSLTTVQTTNWTSSNPSVLSVTSSGLPYGTKITPVATGIATLTAYLPYCNKTITKTITVCVCPGTIAAPSGIPTGNFAWANPPANTYYGYYLGFNTVPGVSSYYMEWFDVTTNSLLNTYVLSGPGYFYYYFTAGHTYKFRVAGLASCGSMGPFSAYSANLLPPAASCANGPISSTLTYTIGCGGGSNCPYANTSWPAIATASQYKVEYKIQNVSAGLISTSGTVYPTTANTTVYFTPVSGTGWTLTYRVAAMCSGTYGNFSGWSSNFFIQ
jgi:hypothetical protein